VAVEEWSLITILQRTYDQPQWIAITIPPDFDKPVQMLRMLWSGRGQATSTGYDIKYANGTVDDVAGTNLQPMDLELLVLAPLDGGNPYIKNAGTHNASWFEPEPNLGYVGEYVKRLSGSPISSSSLIQWHHEWQSNWLHRPPETSTSDQSLMPDAVAAVHTWYSK
jgi:hypothetical protein